MERVNKILNHDLFKEYVQKNRMAEENRRFCHHDMGHLLDVARLAMIFALESDFFSGDSEEDSLQGREQGVCGAYDKAGAEAEKELIYAAALLHDIGRWRQYEDGTPHEKVSARLVPKILADCGFTEAETAQIVTAVSEHRDETVKERQSLSGILYRADKMSRGCFCCEMEHACDWKGSKKNLILQY